MKNLSNQSLALREFLKSQLAEKGLSYSYLASRIKVSVPTIKRWMTKDDIPFEKLLDFLRALDLTFSDLGAALNFERLRSRPVLSKRDEEYLAQNPKEAYVLLLVSLGYTFQEVLGLLEAKAGPLEKILISLDKNNLVEFHSQNSIRSLIDPPIRWSESGPFAKRYFQKLEQAIIDEARFASRDHSVFGEVYMSGELENEFFKELKATVQKYRAIARLNRTHQNISKLRPVSYFVLAKPFSAWKKVMWD